jgi:hypothetical protein
MESQVFSLETTFASLSRNNVSGTYPYPYWKSLLSAESFVESKACGILGLVFTTFGGTIVIQVKTL